VSDEFTVPLCRGHHREVHRCCDEADWWWRFVVEPTAVVRGCGLRRIPFAQLKTNPMLTKLWLATSGTTRGLIGQMTAPVKAVPRGASKPATSRE
jgi:hypothetical protein